MLQGRGLEGWGLGLAEIFFSPDPGNLLNLIFRDWPRSGEF